MTNGTPQEGPLSFREGHGMKFLLLDAVYLLLVMGWTVVLPPMGRDLLRGEVGHGPVFIDFWCHLLAGDLASVPLYHVAALQLLYLCMVLVFFLCCFSAVGCFRHAVFPWKPSPIVRGLLPSFSLRLGCMT